MYWRTITFSVLLLALASAAGAAPTIGNTAGVAGVYAVSYRVGTQMPAVTSDTAATECGDAAFVGVADAFLKPASYLSAPDSQSAALPAVPPAVLMVILGALCIVLVRDRAVWFAALSGMVWVGVMGIQLVPQLVLRLAQGYNSGQLDVVIAARLAHREGSWRLRSDTEGTGFIGLLRHLAGIPLAADSGTIQSRNVTLPWLCAIVSERRGFGALSICLASEARHIVRILPGSAIASVVRGFPDPEKKLLTLEVT
jgi:hypothetical protein